jgi:hypothetical protein
MPMFENVSFGTCETWVMAKCTGSVTINVQQNILWNSVTFVGVLNTIVSIVTFQD